MWKPRVYIAVTVTAFIICVAIAASAIYIILSRKKKKKLHHDSLCTKSLDLEHQHLSLSIRTVSETKISFEESSSKKLQLVVETFTAEELTTATDHFSSTNLIDGTVYHGRHNGKSLAIKCTDHRTISKIKFELFHDATHFHPNLIRLLGTCTIGSHGSTSADDHNAFLVFEYSKNGSLKDWIHGGLAVKSHFIASCYCFLTWNQRLRICLDVAIALQYMHQIMNPSYVHRNLRSRNIFLDEEFNAKVGNFGMEECGEHDHFSKGEPSSENLYPMRWDRGYIAPELKNSDAITASIDIYAFGVVLLEILSGKPPVSIRSKLEKEEEEVLLSAEIKIILQSSIADEKLREWMDNVLGENYSFDAAITIANLARACVEDGPLLRPNAGEVVQKLSKLVAELPEGEEKQFVVNESSCKPLVVKPVCD
ncbi:protein LYK2 [Cynara cardunculus var. scolymus]|uniref:Protein kinase, catalytic domain-containing protein n=1 Tax=Cynara cardunculus var. scolymus TaxID=59895 RepID=A0A118K5J7_CYNCS|nr:protein LYK2 [Cynara cardunculus var. scolymus]KVI09213.1 Protein kinase, catalytic domain-containing protein [Cynara cardunculus var. scolymus]